MLGPCWETVFHLQLDCITGHIRFVRCSEVTLVSRLSASFSKMNCGLLEEPSSHSQQASGVRRSPSPAGICAETLGRWRRFSTNQ